MFQLHTCCSSITNTCVHGSAKCGTGKEYALMGGKGANMCTTCVSRVCSVHHVLWSKKSVVKMFLN